MSAKSDSRTSFNTFSFDTLDTFYRRKIGVEEKKQGDSDSSGGESSISTFERVSFVFEPLKTQRKYRIAKIIIYICAFSFLLLGRVSNILGMGLPSHLKNIKIIKLSLSIAEVSFSCSGGIFFLVVILIEIVAIRRFS